MARAVSVMGATVAPLSVGWRLALTPSGACATPDDARRLDDWIPAFVPGTVAQALQAAGRWRLDDPEPLHGRDAWYRCGLTGRGRRTLRLEGLATIAEVWLDDRLILTSDSMFLAHEFEVDLDRDAGLWLCFRALEPRLAGRGPRARWRPQMISPQGVRLVRTTLLGHMPGWCPPVHAVGPWRPISLIEAGDVRATAVSLIAGFQDGVGALEVSATLAGGDRAELICAGRRTLMTSLGDGRFQASLMLEDAQPWWPHTHGDQPLYDVQVQVGDALVDLGRTGFRRIDVDRGRDGRGFGLRINGEPVFCRGACWNTPDIVALPGDREAYEPRLRLARDAGMNMLRVGGTGVYETPAFFELCDELGLMVWQDFMFANFDYPASDPTFAASATAEAERFLSDVQASPSVTVLCGGSEVHQQAAMMGLPGSALASPLFDQILPGAAAQWRPDVPYVVNAPSGGALPFVADEGVTHYYGVGAYGRPLEDARRAEVRFAAECLAFANVPQASTLERDLPGVAAVHDPRWKARTPRDRGASWDFEDVRDHYLALLHGVDPARLRREDPGLYLDLSRAVTGEVMEATFAEWRRDRSPCAGALVWNFQDLWPGAGWGVVDSRGEPKPAWYALKRAFRPVQAALTDEGCNGLSIHVRNETQQPVAAELRLSCLREGRTPVISLTRELDLQPRAALELSAYELAGAFFDFTYAYRFGPPVHDVTVARLHDARTGDVLSEAFHFPQGRATRPGEAKVEAEIERRGSDWMLRLTTDRFVPSLHIRDEAFRPDDDWFHLAPGAAKHVLLHARTHGSGQPAGDVRRPGGGVVATYAAAS